MLFLIFQLLQMSFFGLAAVNDLQPHSESTLNKSKDLLFSIFAFPVGMVRNVLKSHIHLKRASHSLYVVCILLVCCSTFLEYFCLWQRISLPSQYWHLLPSLDKPCYGLYTYIFYWWIELIWIILSQSVTQLFSQHTFVLPIICGEMLMQPHVYPRTKHALAALGVVGSAYLFWWVLSQRACFQTFTSITTFTP